MCGRGIHEDTGGENSRRLFDRLLAGKSLHGRGSRAWLVIPRVLRATISSRKLLSGRSPFVPRAVLMQTPSPSVLNNYALKPVSHPFSSIRRPSSFCFAEFQPINRITGILIVE